MKSFNPGEEIETSIVQISGDNIFIDLGLKSEGIVSKSEFTDENGNCSVKEGDKIKVYFVGSNHDELLFTTKIKGEKANAEILKNAFDSKIPVEGKVEKEIKGGFEVKIGEARAFCPYSQMGYKNRLEMSEYVGRTVQFLITEFKNEGKNVIVSNRVLEEQKEFNKISSLSQKIKEGETVKGTVISIQSYGAFIDVDGFQALLPASEISHQRVENIEDFVKVGQELSLKVIKTDWNASKPEKSRVSLSLKSLEKDPWSSINSSLKIGDKISGKIVRIAPFGLFVNLLPGIDGLVHISKIENISQSTNLSKKFKIGETFDVVVEKIETEEKRISLTPATSNEQDKEAENYLSKQDDSGESYNPFAALLKK